MPPEWFFTRNDGKRVGPYTPQQLTYMASSGKLTPDGSLCGKGRNRAAMTQTFKMVATPPKRPH
jgi:hypothetical protein